MLGHLGSKIIWEQPVMGAPIFVLSVKRDRLSEIK